MPSLPDRNTVLDELSELSELRPAMVEAWDRWGALSPEFRVDMNDSARATIIQRLIVSAALKRLPTANVHIKAHLVIFAVGNYAIRFKKLDEELISRNQDTTQVRQFMGQIALEGIPTTHNLEAGYVLNPLGTEIASTNLVCPNGYKNPPYWNIELHDVGYELSEVQDLFADRSEPREEEKGARWKSRESGVIIPFDIGKKR